MQSGEQEAEISPLGNGMGQWVERIDRRTTNSKLPTKVALEPTFARGLPHGKYGHVRTSQAKRTSELAGNNSFNGEFTRIVVVLAIVA